MDIERGNIEIVFQKIPYMYVIKSQQEMVDYCSYSKMEKDIYMRYSSDVFSYATDDERSKRAVAELAVAYTEKQTAVISGMAKGVDSYAHTACLKAKGYTVAVLANGLDICYPSEHEKLKECIENKGLVISEYPPGIRPTKYTFPKRNRLISAWSDELIVVAAGKKSGALITADYSKKYGRKIIYCE